jgi:1-acyl-sn-glycerol-3-phosphate acyltransferase
MTGRKASATSEISIEEARRDALQRRSRWLSSWKGRARATASIVATVFLLCGTAVVTLFIAACTLFRKRRLYTEVMARWLAETILQFCGVTLVVHREQPLRQEQRMYVINHTSTLDMFILLSLGLPNTRYFMRGKYRRIIPLGIITSLMGTFFTPSQSQPAARVKCFQNAERVLRRTGDSVCLSPEGTRVTDGKIGRFNKGAFHLATNMKLPIVPLFIDIPPETNPGTGWGVIPGAVHVYILPEILTDEWRLKDLEENKERVRSVYVRFQEGLRVAALATQLPQTGPVVLPDEV